MAKAPDGPVYLLSDPDLMNNQGLKDLTRLFHRHSHCQRAAGRQAAR